MRKGRGEASQCEKGIFLLDAGETGSHSCLASNTRHWYLYQASSVTLLISATQQP